MSREQIQRLALVVLVVCLAAFVGNRMLHAGRHLADHDPHGHDEDAFEAGMEAVEAEMEALEAKLEAEMEAGLGADVGANIGGEVLFQQSFPVQPGDRLSVALSSEDLIVETGPGESSVTVLGRGNDARDAFSQRRFSASYGDGTLRIATERDRDRRSGTRASYTVVVRIPARLDAELHLASGDVQVGALKGDLRLGTASGDVALRRVEDATTLSINTASGDVRAELLDGVTVTVNTASGDVAIDRFAARTAEVHTASGDVVIEAAGADRFEVRTASGDVAVERLDTDDLSVETGSGDVAVGLERAVPVRVATGSGDVALGLPRAGFDVELDGPSIDIDSALDFQGQRGRRSAEGRLGGGGASLAVTTGGGEIALVVR